MEWIDFFLLIDDNLCVRCAYVSVYLSILHRKHWQYWPHQHHSEELERERECDANKLEVKRWEKILIGILFLKRIEFFSPQLILGFLLLSNIFGLFYRIDFTIFDLVRCDLFVGVRFFFLVNLHRFYNFHQLE